MKIFGNIGFLLRKPRMIIYLLTLWGIVGGFVALAVMLRKGPIAGIKCGALLALACFLYHILFGPLTRLDNKD